MVFQLEEMEDYYQILGVSPSATYTDVKRAFQQLALQYHPDKLLKRPLDELESDAVTSSDISSKFLLVSRAWKVLGNADSRREYDAAWYQRCIAQDLPVQDVIDVDEFVADASGTYYEYPCRCGSDYQLTALQLSFQVDYVSCPSCSLCMKLQYSRFV